MANIATVLSLVSVEHPASVKGKVLERSPRSDEPSMAAIAKDEPRSHLSQGNLEGG